MPFSSLPFLAGSVIAAHLRKLRLGSTNAALALVMFMLALCPDLSAYTIVVTNLNDSGPGSLREACATTFPFPDTIDLRNVSGNILVKGEMFLRSVIIGNPLAPVTLVDDQPSELTEPVAAFFRGQNLQILYMNFKNADGRSALLAGGTMFVKGCVFENNTSLMIFNQTFGSSTPNLYVEGSVFINNKMVISVTGGVSHIEFQNCTFYQNDVLVGQEYPDVSNFGVYFYNSTAWDCNYLIKIPFAIFPLVYASSSILHFANFNDNTDETIRRQDGRVYYKSLSFMGTKNIGPSLDLLEMGVDVDPQLVPSLNYTVGPRPVFTLQANSPAVDAGENLLGLPNDQIGAKRTKGAFTDIGAYESNFVSPYTPAINLPDEIKTCNFPYTLDAGPGFASYKWSTGKTTQTIQVNSPGFFFVTVKNQEGYQATDSAVVVKGLSQFTIGIQEIACANTLTLDAGNFRSYKWSTGATTPTIVVSQSGVVEVEVTDNFGCKASEKLAVTIPTGTTCNQPSPPIGPLMVQAVCSDLPALLRRWKISNPNTSNVRMDWEIAGTIQRSWIDVPPGDSYLTTVAVLLNPNTLKVYWHNERGQKQVLEKASITTKCTKQGTNARAATEEIAEQSSAPGLHVFPNPATSQLTIELPSDQEADARLKIISLKGDVQDSYNVRLGIGHNYIVHDVTKLAPGTYVVQVGNKSIRFLKE